MNSRAKGARAETELAAKLRSLGFHEAERQAAAYLPGYEAADVVGIRGVHLECKRVEKLNVDKAMEQSEADAAITKELPAVVHRRNRRPWLLTVRLDDLHRLVEVLKR